MEPEPSLFSLSPDLCQQVAKGLVLYVMALTDGSNWQLVPIACKVSSLKAFNNHPV